MPVNKECVQWLVDDLLKTDQRLQGKNRLTTVIDGEEYDCCLGRACKTAMAHGLELEIADDYDTANSSLTEPQVLCRTYNGEKAVMPPAVREWYGFNTNNPNIDSGDIENSASYMNDDMNKGFSEIGYAFQRTYLQD